MPQHQLPSDLKAKLAQKRLIFTVTPGRSGTNYMANMLTYLSNVCSRHEPEPDLHRVLREVQHNPDLAYEILIEQKLPLIAEVSEPIYVETSHLLCKGFLEPIADLGLVPDIVILRRSPHKVASSMFKLGHVPARTDVGRAFLVQPDDPGVLPIENWESLHDYQLAFWYTLEIERRSQAYKEKFLTLGSQVVETTLEEFSTIVGYYRFLNTMNLPLPPPINILKHLKSHIRRVNNKDKLKEERESIDFAALEAEVFERIPYNPLEKLAT